MHRAGHKDRVRPDLIAPDRSLSIRQGALRPFVKRDGEMTDWRMAMLEGVAKRLGFTLDTPLQDLAPEQFHALMFGADGTDGRLPQPLGTHPLHRHGVWKGSSTS